MLRRLVGAALVSILLATPSISRAEPDPPPAAATDTDTTAAAETLFERGKSLMAEKKYAEACAEFAESQRLDAGVGTMLYLADCYETNGQTASAWGVFREAESVANREADVHRAQIAHDRAVALEQKLVRLIVVVSGARPKGLEVRRDDILLGEPLFGTPVPVDPGEHELRATAPGRIPWSMKIRVGDAPTTSISVPTLAVETPAAPISQPTTPHDTTSTGRGNTQRALGLLAGGVGLAAVGVGAVFGVVAKNKVDASNSNGHCSPASDGTDRCDGTGIQDRDSARSASTLSTVFVLSGAAFVTAGVTLYLLAPRDHAPDHASLALGPIIGGANGLLLNGRF